MKTPEHLQATPTWHANVRQAPIIVLGGTLGLMAPHFEALLPVGPACMRGESGCILVEAVSEAHIVGNFGTMRKYHVALE